jgi:hypothetical protein
MAIVELEQEYDYYQKNKAALVAKYNGKYLVIRGHDIVGAYDTDIEAYKDASSKYPAGTFLIQKCEPAKVTQVYHSRVSFYKG